MLGARHGDELDDVHLSATHSCLPNRPRRHSPPKPTASFLNVVSLITGVPVSAATVLGSVYTSVIQIFFVFRTMEVEGGARVVAGI